jgi:signal recognition particle receptor subunit beta
MKTILEIPVISNRLTGKEKLYSLLSDIPLRNFQGLKFGAINLDRNHEIYLYFLNQDQETFHYLWDLIIPHALGCLVMCDWDNQEIFESNLAVIEKLEEEYSTPIHICVLKPQKNSIDRILKEGLLLNQDKKLLFFDPENKDSAKKILLNMLS